MVDLVVSRNRPQSRNRTARLYHVYRVLRVIIVLKDEIVVNRSISFQLFSKGGGACSNQKVRTEIHHSMVLSMVLSSVCPMS